MRFLCETIEMHVTHVIDKIDLSTNHVNIVMLTKVIIRLLTTQRFEHEKVLKVIKKVQSNF